MEATVLRQVLVTKIESMHDEMGQLERANPRIRNTAAFHQLRGRREALEAVLLTLECSVSPADDNLVTRL